MIISWNVRGLNKAGKCREIATRLKKLGPKIGILIETRVKVNKKDGVRNKLGGYWEFLDNYQSHDNGRLWIMWDKTKVCLKGIQYTDQLVLFRVDNASGDFQMWGTAIYAHNTLDKRRILRGDIKKIAQNV